MGVFFHFIYQLVSISIIDKISSRVFLYLIQITKVMQKDTFIDFCSIFKVISYQYRGMFVRRLSTRVLAR